MRALIVYYSLDGNTAYAASRIQQTVGADLLRLHPVKEPPLHGFRKYFEGGRAATFHETPELEPIALNLTSYDVIILGCPVWAGTFPPAVGTFLKRYPLKAGRIYLFGCSSSGNAEKMFRGIAKSLGTEPALTVSLLDPLTHHETEDARIDRFAREISAGKD